MSSGEATAMVSTGPGLAKTEPPALHTIGPAWIPRSMKQIGRLAEIIVASGLAPKAIMMAPSPRAAAYVVISTGLEMGLGVMQAMRHIFVTPEGKVGVSASIIVSRVKRAKTCRYFRIVKMDTKECTCETHREGEPEPTGLTWTIEDAKAANLLGKDNWKKYPRAMLRNRCQAELARAVYPDEVDGVYDPDELGAITTEDGEIIEVRGDSQRRAPSPPPSEPRSEPKPAPDLDAMLKDFERRIGEVVTSGGTTADVKAIAAEVGRSPLDADRREHLDQIYVLALEAVECRSAS